MHTPAIPAYFILWFTLSDFYTHNHITKAQQISINSIGCNKQIQWNGNIGVFYRENIRSECQDYGLENQDINIQFHSHLKLSEARASDECCKELMNGTEQSYGVLRKAQIIPLWCFVLDSDKRDSCVGTNVILVWKSIADEQLKKVDLFIAAVISCLDDYHRTSQCVTFGVHDEYALFNYTLDAKYQQISIPKIIYRVIRGSWNNDIYDAVIIIHNEPVSVSDSDKLCHNIEMGSGWDMITSNDPKSGLTYVCDLTSELANKLGIDRDLGADTLHLNAIPYSDHPGWANWYTYQIQDRDITSDVDYMFKRLCEDIGIENHNQTPSAEIPSFEKF